MKTVEGKTINSGIAYGKIKVIDFWEKKSKSDSGEKKRGWQEFSDAKDIAAAQLRKMQAALNDRLKDHADTGFLDIQISFLENDSLLNMVRRYIGEGEDALEASERVCAEYVQKFLGLDNDYMRERAKDVRDVFERIKNIMSGTEEGMEIEEPAVIACVDLSPSETAGLEPEKVLGIIAQKSTAYSHMAIMARMLGIPTVTGVDIGLFEGADNETVVLDGDEGIVYLNPDSETISLYKRKTEKEREKKERLKALLDVPACTKSGRKIKLYANVAGEEEVKYVIENGADGIGLLRSEFIYMHSDTYPTEERLFDAYRHVLEEMKGKKVVIRTMDIGADKAADYFGLEPEENPAMGYRGIRICLDRTDLFKTQLRALLRASKYGNLAIMFPMITDVSEVQKCKEILEDVKREVESAAFETGIMIETPAAALISEKLAGEVDFFSIGTNDLLQFTVAADRMNPKLEGTYDKRHPALLMLVEMAVKAAKKAGIWVGVCGELAGEESLAEWFVSNGVDELSVSASCILELKEKIRSLD